MPHLSFLPAALLPMLTLGLVIVATAAALAFELVVLLSNSRRRLQIRQRAAEAQAPMIAELLTMIAGRRPDPGAGAFSAAGEEERLEALQRLLALLGGDDRERLIAFAHRCGMLERWLARLSSEGGAARIRAVRVLAMFPSNASISALTRCALDDEDPRLQVEAAIALVRAQRLPPPDRLLPALAPQFSSARPNPLICAILAGLARQFPDEIARHSFSPSFAKIRAALVEALGASGDPMMIDCLAVHRADADPEVRAASLKAARRIGWPRAAAWTGQLLSDDEEIVVVQALSCCTALGATSERDRIAELAGSPAGWVRTRAREALAEFDEAAVREDSHPVTETA